MLPFNPAPRRLPALTFGEETESVVAVPLVYAGFGTSTG